MDDGNKTIFLSTAGKHPEEVPKELVKFLEYVHAELEESQQEWNDEYIHSLQKRVAEIKASRKMRGLYMYIREVFGEEFMEGIEEARKEGKLELLHSQISSRLARKGTIPSALQERIDNETDLQILDQWSVYAITCADIEDFENSIKSR